MALGENDKSYTLFGKLPDGWLINLQIDKQGIASARVKQRREDPNSLAEIAKWALLSDAPRPGGLGLPATGISIEKRDEDGMWDLEWSFEGFAGDPNSVAFGALETTSYELDCIAKNEPVETHPNFLKVVKDYGQEGQIDKKTRQFNGWTPYLPNAAALALGITPGAGVGISDALATENPLFGMEDVLMPTMIWRVSSCCRTLPADFRTKLGKIDIPRIVGGGPQPPQLEGRANWLKAVARADWRGNIYSTQEEYWASGPNGWARDFYLDRA